MDTEFIAYAGDCCVRGLVDVEPGARMSDLLNAATEVVLRDATLTSHADGHTVQLSEMTIACEDLYAIEASKARGEAGRRLHTVKHRIQMKLGPYVVLGNLHVLPGNAPLATIPKRAPMIPLTSATMAYGDNGELDVHEVDTLIVNRWLADWVRAEEPDMSYFATAPVAGAATTG